MPRRSGSRSRPFDLRVGFAVIASAPPSLTFTAVEKRFAAVTAVGGVDLAIAPGSFVALVGASGAGKSTLLRMVNRLIEPDSGTVLIDGEPVSAGPAPALRRRIGYVFQDIGLFPHMTVGENVGIGLRLAGAANPARVAQMLALVELDPALAARLPHELSGGQRQRVGVARALAPAPRLLLMDEPFGALDPVTRHALGQRVRALHGELGLTTVMVTHDIAEALLLATRVVVMAAGQIVADELPQALLGGAGGAQAQALVAVPRDRARALAGMTK